MYITSVWPAASAKLGFHWVLRRKKHFTPIPATLHWLPVRFRVDFKVAQFVDEALNEPVTSYTAELSGPYVASRPLRSSKMHLNPGSRLTFTDQHLKFSF